MEGTQSRNIERFQDQFQSMWVDVQVKSATELRSRKKMSIVSQKDIRPIGLDTGDTVIPELTLQQLQKHAGKKFTINARTRKSPTEGSYIEVSLPIGQIKLHAVSVRHSK